MTTPSSSDRADALRAEMVVVGRQIHDAGLVAATDGNLSARLDDRHVLITPSGVALAELTVDDPVVIDDGGRPVTSGRPSSEFRVHLACFRARPDVNAVIHAHPPLANALTFAGVRLDEPIVPEVVATLIHIPVSAYATPSSQEGADVITSLIADRDAVMLARHGSVTVGPDLRSAFHKLEKIEHTARIIFTARLLGGPQPLADHEIRKLALLREELGIGSADEVLRAFDLE